MKLREKIKRFWTLDVHGHEGFTLVELIIVIAILAILSSVAVVGYSSYVEKANKQADLTLAAEIEQALLLAYYSDALTAGDYVVIKYGADAEYGNTNATAENPINTAAAAMAAAYGDGWQEALQLKWTGWKEEMGSYPSAEEMANVNASNFKTENMNAMLGQVQSVVNEAANYILGAGIAEQGVKDYLNNAGIQSETIDESNATAAANATVFFVADNLSKVGPESEGINTQQFWARWKMGTLNKYEGWDKPTREAAQYAMVYAAATYVDAQENTDYCKQLADAKGTGIIGKCSSVLTEIKNTSAWTTYKGDGSESSLMYKDAMAFLTYMEGISTSADSLTATTDLTKANYFNDGTVINYVNDYVSLNDVLSGITVEDGAFVFFFNGETISCLPLDY